MKKTMGLVEAVFDISYMAAASIVGFLLIFGSDLGSERFMAGIMALVLVAGDAFHLVPRIMYILSGGPDRLIPALGVGKQVTSVTMTIFYILLWHIAVMVYRPANIGLWTAVVYGLSLVRIGLCLAPHNEWRSKNAPVKWGIIRNIPFVLEGLMVAVIYFLGGGAVPELKLMWLAIGLSFAFYMPVVLWSNRYPKIGMLMLPKTCTYLWMICMFLKI